VHRARLARLDLLPTENGNSLEPDVRHTVTLLDKNPQKPVPGNWGGNDTVASIEIRERAIESRC